jgi:quercetin dioxygenase-like cupin family protein
MKRKKNFIAGAMITIGLCILTFQGSAQTKPAGTARTLLQQADLSVPGLEMVQARVDIEPGAVFPRHKHPGEEIIYVLEGLLEYQVEDGAPVILKAGDVLFIPNGKIHSLKNISSVKGAELATYIVEKGKPLVTIVQ